MERTAGEGKVSFVLHRSVGARVTPLRVPSSSIYVVGETE